MFWGKWDPLITVGSNVSLPKRTWISLTCSENAKAFRNTFWSVKSKREVSNRGLPKTQVRICSTKVTSPNKVYLSDTTLNETIGSEVIFITHLQAGRELVQIKFQKVRKPVALWQKGSNEDFFDIWTIASTSNTVWTLRKQIIIKYHLLPKLLALSAVNSIVEVWGSTMWGKDLTRVPTNLPKLCRCMTE